MFKRNLWPTCFALLLLVVAVYGCEKPRGGFSESCGDDGSCDESLVCVSDICVRSSTHESHDEDPQPESDQVREGANDDARRATETSRADTLAESLQDAMFTYRYQNADWNGLDDQSYFGTYAEQMDCFYNSSSYTRDELEATSRGDHFRNRTRSYLYTHQLSTLESSESRVVFRDRGTFVEANSRTHEHSKVVVLEKRIGEDRWEIMTEVSSSAHDCFPTYFEGPRAGEDGEPTNASLCDGVGECFSGCLRRLGETGDESGIEPCRSACERRYPHHIWCTGYPLPVRGACRALEGCKLASAVDCYTIPCGTSGATRRSACEARFAERCRNE